ARGREISMDKTMLPKSHHLRQPRILGQQLPNSTISQVGAAIALRAIDHQNHAQKHKRPVESAPAGDAKVAKQSKANGQKCESGPDHSQERSSPSEFSSLERKPSPGQGPYRPIARQII